jgi:hypothetical protein
VKGQRATGAEKKTAATTPNEGVEDRLPGSTDGSADGSMDGAFGAGIGQVRRRISSGAIIMGAVVLASIASLWSMRAIDRAAATGPKQDKKLEEEINKALERGSTRAVALETDADVLLEPTEAHDDVRVPLKDLAKNPFLVWNDGKQPAAAPTPEDEPVVDTAAERLAAWQTSVDNAALAIRLQSTMSGTGPQGATGIANINGHMMRIGDTFGVDGTEIEFRIQAIERDQMTVSAFNAEFRHERSVIVPVLKKR